MTPLLEKALSELQKLKPTEQDAIAARILEEIADEERWDAAFERSADVLSRMAEEVRAEVRAGRVKPMDLNGL